MTRSKIDSTANTITITSASDSENTISLDSFFTTTTYTASDNITITASPYTMGHVTGINSIGTIDVSSLTGSAIWGSSFANVLWSDCMPDMDTVTKMCEEYPSLAKAYENFKTVYTLVEQDYKGKQEENK